MQLVMGLGNPGRQYSRTRHNAGFMALDQFASSKNIGFNHRECLSRTGSWTGNGSTVILAKPLTYMNLSGEAVRRLSAKYRVKPSCLLVVHDDLDLQPGKLRLRFGGSSAGHKGVESIIASLGTRDFMRLKIGIGRPDNAPSEDEIVDYVLGEFTQQERRILLETFPVAGKAIEMVISDGIEKAMNRFNRFIAQS